MYEFYGLFKESNGALTAISFSAGWKKTLPIVALFETYYDAAQNVVPGVVIKKVRVKIEEV